MKMPPRHAAGPTLRDETEERVAPAHAMCAQCLKESNSRSAKLLGSRPDLRTFFPAYPSKG